MRILIATVPAAGHFNPLTGPAVRLAELGHDVRWYAGPDTRNGQSGSGSRSSRTTRPTRSPADNVNALFPERQKLKGPKAIEFDGDVFFARPAQAQFRDIRDARASDSLSTLS